VVSSPVVSARFAIFPASRRVYTLMLSLTIALFGIGCRAPAPSAQGVPALGAQDRVAVTVDTQMSKGPATAPVTIVEFSDYQ
jgi:protein-disulfide isomerase